MFAVRYTYGANRVSSPSNQRPARTEFAEDRSVLANERTYTAWMRTGFAALVSGLAVLRLLEHLLPHWGLRLLALGLIAYSAFCFVADPRCRGKVEHRPGPTHEIGAVDQAAYKDAFLLEDA